MANEWIVNKGRQRAPFAKGTLVDVVYQNKAEGGFDYPDEEGGGTLVRISNEEHERTGVVCGGFYAHSWSLNNAEGDILRYRLTETEGANNV